MIINMKWFICGFICVSLCQSIGIKPTKQYMASTRVQFKINTEGCWNWHLCIPYGLSVVQCSLRHVIGIVFFYTISVAWINHAGQLAAGGVASVWRSWVQSPAPPPPPPPHSFWGHLLLQLIWRSCTCRWDLWDPHLHKSCSDLN